MELFHSKKFCWSMCHNFTSLLSKIQGLLCSVGPLQGGVVVLSHPAGQRNCAPSGHCFIWGDWLQGIVIWVNRGRKREKKWQNIVCIWLRSVKDRSSRHHAVWKSELDAHPTYKSDKPTKCITYWDLSWLSLSLLVRWSIYLYLFKK